MFGDYLDIYDLSRAVADGATVKVFYEGHHVPSGLPDNVDPDYLDERADDAIAALPEAEQRQVQNAFRIVEEMLAVPERLKQIAAHLVSHWETRARRNDQAHRRSR